MNNKTYIILVNYNSWKETLDCVKSLSFLDPNTVGIIVVDNCSTNDSLMQLRNGLPVSVKIIPSEINNGFSAGNNIGIRYALKHNAKYVLLLNNDTVADEDFLSPLIKYADNHPKCGCISPRIYFYYDKSKIWYDGGTFHPFSCRAEHYRYEQYNSDITGINEAKFISGCCMLIPLHVINEIGLMDEEYFLYVEDTEYCLRISKAGYKMYWDADHHIFHKVSSSTGKKSMLSQYYEIRNRILLSKKYLSLLQRITMKFYDLFFYTHKVISNQYDRKVLCKAMYDGSHGVKGKQTF